MALESVVRPFETRSKFSTKRIPAKNSDPKVKSSGGNCTAALCWGDVGTKPTPVPDGLSVETNDCNESNSELQGRSSKDIRIENPDDPDQYVVVRRPTVIRFKHKEGKSSSWAAMSDVATDVQAWEADLSADLGLSKTEDKCAMKMTLKAPDESDTN